MSEKIGIRWTLGDVSERGFKSLQLSIWGAWRIFGDRAQYAVCVNTISIKHARHQTGDLPAKIDWHDCTRAVPGFLRGLFDVTMAEGVAWKFAPLRLFPDAYEISLDNDCVLWEMPPTLRRWLSGVSPLQCMMAEDVKACFGQFAPQCGKHPRNAGIRGFPPGFDFESALRQVIAHHHLHNGNPPPFSSETDEQGLQTAALSLHTPVAAVGLDEVTVCSPFHPHLPHLGRCGAHFVGLNARHIPWKYFGRPADHCMRDHWNRHYPEMRTRLALPSFQRALPREESCVRA